MKQAASVIYGAGGHARVMKEALQLAKKYKLVANVVGDYYKTEYEEGCNQIIFVPSELSKFKHLEIEFGFLGVGDNDARQKHFEWFEQFNIKCPPLCHSSAIVSSTASLAEGCFVNMAASVQANALIGKGSIINTAAIVEHDCQIGAFVHISPGVVMGGACVVGDSSWIGIGATIKDHINIGSHSMIGAGAVVVEDVPDHTMVMGIPARIVSKWPPND